jgi:AcrR family transcriptional regulator
MTSVQGVGRAAAGRRPQPKVESDLKARRYDPAETRARVLEAAYLLFGTRGYSNTGTADIAAQADVSEGSIFYHFGSKRALLIELGKLHGQKMIAAMQGANSLDELTFETSLNRCFEFAEVNNVWEEVVGDGDCKPAAKKLKENPDAEPFFHATKEIVVAWTRAHMDAVAARHGATDIDTEVAANLIFALVGEAMHQYFAPETSEAEKARIRAECIRFCTAAAGHPAVRPCA